MFLEAFENIGKSKKNLNLFEFLLMEFARRETYPIGIINLPVIFGEG